MRTQEDLVKNFARREGADVVGIAAADDPDFEQARQGCKPTDILPGAQSVVVMGLRILYGTCDSPNLRVYSVNVRTVYDQLDDLGYRMAMFLEDMGYNSTFVASYLPLDFSDKRKGFIGDISQRHAAVVAGLGTIGDSTLCITPDFGPRVRFTSVLTVAPLKADKKIEDDLCYHDLACVEACPVGAISRNQAARISATGNKRVDFSKCIRAEFPDGVASMVRFLTHEIEGKTTAERIEAWRSERFRMLYQYPESQGMIAGCLECLKVCKGGKEAAKANRLKKK